MRLMCMSVGFALEQSAGPAVGIEGHGCVVDLDVTRGLTDGGRPTCRGALLRLTAVGIWICKDSGSGSDCCCDGYGTAIIANRTGMTGLSWWC